MAPIHLFIQMINLTTDADMRDVRVSASSFLWCVYYTHYTQAEQWNSEHVSRGCKYVFFIRMCFSLSLALSRFLSHSDFIAVIVPILHSNQCACINDNGDSTSAMQHQFHSLDKATERKKHTRNGCINQFCVCHIEMVF